MDIIRLNLERYNKSEKRKIGLMIEDSTNLIKEGQFSKAISICNEAMDIDPTDALIITQKGVAYSRLEKFDDAIMCFDLALNYEPNLAHAMYNKAAVKALQNDVTSALSLLEQSIKYDSRFRMTAKTDEDFFYLRANPDFMMLVGS